MKVYVVTSGEYSSYGIDAIFSTRELAQKFIDDSNYNKYSAVNIEEWELDSAQGEKRIG